MSGSFRYSVKSGLYEHLRADGVVAPVFEGYSGHDEGLNNSALERVHNVGPICIGHYRLLDIRDGGALGPDVIPIVPVPTTYGYAVINGVPTIWERSGFYNHGNSARGGLYASHGCIVTVTGLVDPTSPRRCRRYIGEWIKKGDIALEVVA
jgi:hypothetical protein